MYTCSMLEYTSAWYKKKHACCVTCILMLSTPIHGTKILCFLLLRIFCTAVNNQTHYTSKCNMSNNVKHRVKYCFMLQSHLQAWSDLKRCNSFFCHVLVWVLYLYHIHDNVIKWKHFRVTGLLWGEFTGHRWIPHTKASDTELWPVFFDMHQNQQLRKQWIRRCLRRHRTYYDVIVMGIVLPPCNCMYSTDTMQYFLFWFQFRIKLGV